jgi:hypothetical protein
MRNIVYLKSAYKSLADYEKDTRKRIIAAIERIPQGDVKKLQGEIFINSLKKVAIRGDLFDIEY